MNLLKKLRLEQTPAEEILWRSVRYYQVLGFKFRRQHTILNYIVDFYCVEKHLAIEVDGGIHYEEGRLQKDIIRQVVIEALGVTLIRFTNNEVRFELQAVLDEIITRASTLT